MPADFIKKHKAEEKALKEKDVILDSKTIRSIVVLSQMNLHIWHNESNYRKGIKDGSQRANGTFLINCISVTHGFTKTYFSFPKIISI